MAPVSKLINLFESLTPSEPTSETQHLQPQTPPSMRAFDPSSNNCTTAIATTSSPTTDDFFSLDNHCHNNRNNTNNTNYKHSMLFPTQQYTPTSSLSSSVTSSPSSLRASKRFSAAMSHRFSSINLLLRRQPSAVDLALQDERQHYLSSPTGLGLLALMEPRPVLEVPVLSGRRSHIFDDTCFGGSSSHWDTMTMSTMMMMAEQEHETQPFVMGGIFEVMEGKC